MLCQFSFKNFKSYREETVFDFQAATLPEFSNTLITNEKASPLLPVIRSIRSLAESSPSFFVGMETLVTPDG